MFAFNEQWRRIGGAFLLCCCLLLPAQAGAKKGKEKRFTVAVVAFNNLSADAKLDSLGLGLQSMVTTDLAHVGLVDVVERARFNEIVAEQKLVKSRLMDKRRVVRLGKLAGATHLLGGAFHIQGDKMRIDARLWSVRTGTSIFGETVEGDKDAFFELEKELVKRVIRSLGVKPSAKERAKVARIHTAEFKAFRAYSNGLRSFDEKRYEDALKSLKKANALDDEFKLAVYTLAKYEELIQSIRARAEQSQIVIEERLRKKYDAESAATERSIKALWKIAKKTGRKHSLDRATALFVLANLSDQDWPPDWDRYHVERLQEAFNRAYLQESLAHFPKIPLMAEYATTRRGVRFDPAKDSVEAEFPRLKADLLSRVNQLPSGARSCRGSILYHVPERWGRFQLILGLNSRAAMQLFENLLMKAIGNKPDRFAQCSEGDKDQWNHYRRVRLLNLAYGYRYLLDVDKSTSVLALLSRETDNPTTIQKYADVIQLNRDLKVFLAEHKGSQAVRENVQDLLSRDCGGTYQIPGSEWKMMAERSAGKLSAKIRQKLTYGRDVCRRFLLGAHRMRALSGPFKGTTMSTGPQLARDEVSELRFYQNDLFPERPNAAMLFMADGVQKTDLQIEFLADFVPAKDWGLGAQFERIGPVRARPSVGFFFGLKDIDVSAGRLAHAMGRLTSEFKTHPRPMQGYVLQVHASGVRLSHVTERLRGLYSQGRNFFKTRLIAEKKLAMTDSQVKFSAKLDPKAGTIVLKLNRKSLTFPLPKEHMGYYGLHLVDSGYVGVRDLKIK